MGRISPAGLTNYFLPVFHATDVQGKRKQLLIIRAKIEFKQKMFEISLTLHINASREFVFDWWTDLSSDDVLLAKPLKKRQIISRNPEVIFLRDEEEMYFKRMAFDVKVTLKRPESWISEYEGKDAKARSEYTLRSEANGSTTLFYHTKVEPRGFFTNTFSFIARPFVQRVFSGEMKGFIRTLEAEYQTNKAG